jgi:hypothetical protein
MNPHTDTKQGTRVSEPRRSPSPSAPAAPSGRVAHQLGDDLAGPLTALAGDPGKVPGVLALDQDLDRDRNAGARVDELQILLSDRLQLGVEVAGLRVGGVGRKLVHRSAFLRQHLTLALRRAPAGDDQPARRLQCFLDHQGQRPAGSVYGFAKAVTPILSEPLQGPVYLRSSEHKLPDLVAALHSGEIDIALDGRIDSVKGQIRNTFEAVPDAPVSSFTLEMQGGSKGLLVNSTSLCRGTHKAIADFTGHNGKVEDFNPVLQAKCPKAGKKHGKGKKHHRRARR